MEDCKINGALIHLMTVLNRNIISKYKDVFVWYLGAIKVRVHVPWWGSSGSSWTPWGRRTWRRWRRRGPRTRRGRRGCRGREGYRRCPQNLHGTSRTPTGTRGHSDDDDDEDDGDDDDEDGDEAKKMIRVAGAIMAMMDVGSELVKSEYQQCSTLIIDSFSTLCFKYLYTAWFIHLKTIPASQTCFCYTSNEHV